MRFLRSSFFALALMLAIMPVALASSQWCEADPILLVTTPSGSIVPVYVTTAGDGVEHLATVTAARLSYTASPTADGKKTLVTVTVFVSNDLFGSSFATTSTVSSGPLATGTIYASASGTSGQALKMTFFLDQP